MHTLPIKISVDTKPTGCLGKTLPGMLCYSAVTFLADVATKTDKNFGRLHGFSGQW